MERGAKRVRVHVLTDGRDVPDGSSIQFVGDLQKELDGEQGSRSQPVLSADHSKALNQPVCRSQPCSACAAAEEQQ